MFRSKIKNSGVFSAFCLILLAVSAAALFTGCGKTDAPEASVSATMAPTVVTAAPEAAEVEAPTVLPVEIPAAKEALEINTPYGTLYYPGEWEPFLQVTQTDGQVYTVTFNAVFDDGKTQELFSVLFGCDAKDAFGLLRTENGETVTVRFDAIVFEPDDSWDDRDINVIFTMQEALNDVMEAMALEDMPETAETAPETTVVNSGTGEKKPEATPVATPVLPEDDGEETVFDSAPLELSYPSRWDEYLDVRTNEGAVYSVAYYAHVGDHEEKHLFTIYFGGDEGVSALTTTDANGETVEIRVGAEELEFDDSWDIQDKMIVFAMQEDLNYLLNALS